MYDKEVISRKIIEDASSQAENILLKANQKAEQIVADAKAQSEEEISKVKNLATLDGEMLIQRRQTIAKLDAKKIVLCGKQDIIDGVFEVVKEKLIGMPKEAYLSFVTKQIEEHASNGDCVLICKSAPISCEDILSLGVAKAKNLTAQLGENFGGGIKLLGSKTDIDLSFNAIVKQEGENSLQEISKVLFN
jgi:V/A-type H+-transporting ATPase subunit E